MMLTHIYSDQPILLKAENGKHYILKHDGHLSVVAFDSESEFYKEVFKSE